MNATADAVNAGADWVDVGGPDVFTHTELAALAFGALELPPRVARLPDGLRRAALTLLPPLTPRRIHGPAQFFLTAMSMDMVAPPHGTHHLADHFTELARNH